MFKIKFDGLAALQKNVDDLIKHRIPKMTALTLTETAKGLKAHIESKLPSIFDRPKPWTTNSIRYMSASPEDLNAYVWFKDNSGNAHPATGKLGVTDAWDNQNKSSTRTTTPAGEYLMPQVYGGKRELKPYEWVLRRAGILPVGYYTVPGQGVPLDAYGNITRQQVRQILSAVRAFNEDEDEQRATGSRIGYTVNQTDKSKARLARGTKKKNYAGVVYFVGKPGVSYKQSSRLSAASNFIQYGAATASTNHPFGIWARYQWGGKGQRAGAIKPILLFVKQPNYPVRLPFFEWGQEYVDREFPRNWDRIAAETLEYWRSM